MKTCLSLLSIAALVLCSCQKERKDIEAIADIQGGRCLLYKAGTPFFCLNFSSGFDSNTGSTVCTNNYTAYQGSHSVNGISWLSGNANTCSNASNATAVGSCTVSGGIIYYYNNHWTAGNAQTDCVGSNQNGTWNP